MNSYYEMKQRHREELEKFPMFFAFNQEQFDNGMVELGIAPNDTDKICRLPVSGGFLLKADKHRLDELFTRHDKELSDAIKADISGNGFIYEMFGYELSNHEYGYTLDAEPALRALGLSQDDIDNNPSLARGLKKAKKECLYESV